jgi:hypothetical protein
MKMCKYWDVRVKANLGEDKEFEEVGKPANTFEYDFVKYEKLAMGGREGILSPFFKSSCKLSLCKVKTALVSFHMNAITPFWKTKSEPGFDPGYLNP